MKPAKPHHHIIFMCHQGHGYSRDMADAVIHGIGLHPRENFPNDVVDKTYTHPDGSLVKLSVRGMERARRRLDDGVEMKQLEPHELEERSIMFSFLGNDSELLSSPLPPSLRAALRDGRMKSAHGILSPDDAVRLHALEDLRRTLDNQR